MLLTRVSRRVFKGVTAVPYSSRTEYALTPTISLSTIRPVLLIIRVNNNYAVPTLGQVRESNIGSPSPF